MGAAFGPVEAATTVVLSPTDDVHVNIDPGKMAVRPGDHESFNTVTNAWHTKAFLKFDLSGFSSINSATLHLYEIANGWSAVSDRLDLYFSQDDAWHEFSPYADIPAHTGQRIIRVNNSSGVNQWVSFDMAGYDFTPDLTDDQLTLVLENTESGWNMTTFASKDNDNASIRPYLEVTGELAEPIPAPAAAIVGGLFGIGILFRRNTTPVMS